MLRLTLIVCWFMGDHLVTSNDSPASAQVSTPVSAQWSVTGTSNSSNPCLLLSANMSVIFVHEGEDAETMSEDVRRLHWRTSVPGEARARGHCSDQQAEVSLRWRGEWEHKNLINLVFSSNQRLADLSGVFARIHVHSKRYELTSSMKQFDKKHLSWPHRYCLSCQRILYYPLFKVSSIKKNHNHNLDDDVPPEAFLVIENLVVEVFNQPSPEEKQEDQKNVFTKKTWECEFHLIFFWAPYVIGGSLVFLLLSLVLTFIFKNSLGCSDYSNKTNNYRKM